MKPKTAPKKQIINTLDFMSIKKTCDSARKNLLMVGITGDTGTGKTTALEKISQQENTFYVRFQDNMKNKHFFSALLKKMGVHFEGTLYDMVNVASEALNNLVNPLVLIDEAGKIPASTILCLHDLRDKTKENAGIVMAGMPYFKTNLLKFSNKQKVGYAEFLRRINIWKELNQLTREEIKLICHTNGITDEATVKSLQRKTRFADLENEIFFIHHSEN